MECLSQILDQKYPQFNTISPRHRLTDAMYQMVCENVEYLIVLDQDQFTGLISEHDITQKLMFTEKPLEDVLVADIMNRSLPVANTSDSISHAMQLLDRYNTRFMAIYDGFDFKGVLSENDLLKGAIMARKNEQHPAGMLSYP